jgi:hypothetical protein
MKISSLAFTVTVFGFAFWGGTTPGAASDFRLRTVMYSFPGRADLLAKMEPSRNPDSRTTLFQSPAELPFGDKTLALKGRQFIWGGDGVPPDGFNLVDTPVIDLSVGRPVVLLSSVPIQYLEKSEAGALQVREIPANSPDAPHFRLKFTLQGEADGGARLQLECDVQVAAVGRREGVAGVTLPVGKPVLSRFEEKLDVRVTPQEWSASVVRPAAPGGFGLLVLMKAEPSQSTGARAAEDDKPMSGRDFAALATYYYQHPQPDMIGRAIVSLESNGVLNPAERLSYQYRQRAGICVGFFAEVFGANPDRLPEWRKLIDQRVRDSLTRSWLRSALLVGRRPHGVLDVKSSENSDVSNLYWGAFLASGDPAYLRKLVDQLNKVDDPTGLSFQRGATAMMLLAYNAPHHPLIGKTLEAMLAQVDPRTRELIGHIQHKSVADVRREIANMEPTVDDLPMFPFETTHPSGIPLPTPSDNPFAPWSQR